MADTRITQLPALSASGLASNDVLPIADISASQTKKITAQDLATAGYTLLPSNTIDIAKINQSSTTKIGTTALADSGVTAIKLAANSSIYNGGIAPITNNFDGRGFFNTSTGELKIYNGGTFSSVTTSIGTSSVTSSGLANNAVITAKIADDAVTYDKLQNASTTNVLLGRQSAGAGNFEEITLTAAGRALLDDASASDQRTTLGLGTLAVANGTWSNGSTVSGYVTGTNTGDQTITLTGDVTGTGTGSFAATIGNGVVTSAKIAASGVATSNIQDQAITFAKIQNISATDKILGRSSAGSGTVEEINCSAFGRSIIGQVDAASVRTTLGLGTLALSNGSVTGTNTGDQIIVLTGDVTGSGTGSFAATIASGVITTSKISDSSVTYAKIQNVSATDRLLGRSSANPGIVEEIVCTAAARALLDDATAADQRTTLGLGNLALANGTWSDGSTVSGYVTGTNTGDQTITLTGDVSGTGTGSFAVTIANEAVNAAKILSNSITAGQLANDAITTTKIADGAVTAAKIASGTIVSSSFATGAVDQNALANNSVTYTKMQQTSATNVVLGRSSAGAGPIEEISLTAAGRALIDDLSAADQRITLGLGSLALANGSWVDGSSFSGTSTGINTGDQTIVLSGDLSGTGTGTLAATINSNAITEGKINNGAVTADKIASSGVTASKLANSSVVVVNNSIPVGSGVFVGQQHVNTTTGIEYTWNGTAWQRQAAINTVTFSSSAPITLSASYPDNFSAAITVTADTQPATYVWAGPASGVDAAPVFRALAASDLPNATNSTKGIVQPGTGLQMASGIINHSNSVASGIYTKVTIDDQGHVASGSQLTASDIPALNASVITAGEFTTALIANDAITGAKLANYSVSKIGEALPTADHIGQFFFNPLDKNIYLWDGNVWQPVGVSLGEIVFAGTYNANLNVVASATTVGTAAGLVAGSGLPLASATFSSYYLVVASGGTGVAPAPTTALNPPDIILCDGSAWTEVDVSSTYTSQTASIVGFTPAGTIGSTNVQLAIEEVAAEAANASNLSSGTLAVARGGTGLSSYAKGDLIVASGTTGLAKLTAGTNGYVLRANSSTTTGLEWSADYVGTVTNVTSNTAALTVSGGTTTPALAIRSATTSVDGIVQLTDSISTTSSTLAATATAVKTAYDLANAALPKAGGLLTGNLSLDTNFGIIFEGTTDDGFETTLTATGPSADRAISLPDGDGTLVLSGAIANADINASAAIVDTKLATISTANKVGISALDIDGGTDIGMALADTDLFVVDDGANGTNRKSAISRIGDYIFGKVSGDATITASGVLAISSGVIVNADINAAAGIAASKLAFGTARQLLQTNAAGNAAEWTSNLALPGTLNVAGITTLGSGVVASGTVTLNNQAGLRFADADSSNWVAFQAPSVVASNVTWTLPSSDGSSNQVLRTDGNGVLSWATAGAGDVIAANNNAFTGNNTFHSASGQTFGTATSSQDGIVVRGRAGGTTNLRVTLIPGTLSSSRTLTLPDVTGTVITDGDTGTVTNAMLAGSIADTKLNAISTANKVSLAALDIDGGTDIGSALADADLFIVDDGGAGTNRKAAASRITDYAFGKVSGDITISSAGTAAITSGVIVDADISASAAIADTKLATISTAGKVSGAAITSGNISTSGSIATTSSIAVGQSSAAANTKLDVAGTYAQTVVAVSALDIDCSAGNYFTKTINGNSTFTFSNVATSRAVAFTLELTHTSGTITWPTTVKWPADTAPSLTTGKTHLFFFVTDDGGTRWRASSLVNYTN